MSPLRAAAIDDEPLALSGAALALTRLPGVELVGTAATGREAIGLIERAQPDFVLLDVCIPWPDGLRVAATVARPDGPLIAFMSAHPGYALRAYEIGAFDYLLKPIDPDRLAQCVARAQLHLAARRPSAPLAPPLAYEREIDAVWRRGPEPVPVEAIDRIEAGRRRSILHSVGRRLAVEATIDALEPRLDPALFIRLRRSTIVQRGRIRAVVRGPRGGFTVLLVDGSEIAVSRRYVPRIREMVFTRAPRRGPSANRGGRWGRPPGEANVRTIDEGAEA